MTTYTVLLLHPDYLAEDYGADIYTTTVEADSPDLAIGMAEIQASIACAHAAPPEDFKAIAVFLGVPAGVAFNVAVKGGNQIVCPKCGNTEGDDTFIYIEDIGCSRKILGTDDGVITINSAYTTEGFDENGTNARFGCPGCQHEFPIPPGAAAKIDFV